MFQDKLLICKRFTCTWGLILFTSSSTILRRRSAATALRIEIRSFPTRILRQADAAKSGFKIYCLATLITFLFLGKNPRLCRRKDVDQRKFTQCNTSSLKLIPHFVNVMYLHVKMYNVNPKKVLKAKVLKKLILYYYFVAFCDSALSHLFLHLHGILLARGKWLKTLFYSNRFK